MANLLKWLKDRKEEVVAQVNPFDQGRTAHTVRQNITPTPPPQRQQPTPPPQSQFRFPTAPPVSSIPKPTSHFKFADNSITRGLSRAYDQINPVDAGRSWQQTEASNIASKRSGGAQLRALTGQQTAEDINALYADTEKLQRQSIQDFNAGKIDKTQHIKNMQTAANQSSAVQKTTNSSIDTSLPNIASRKIFGQDYTGKEEGGISSAVGRITRPALNIGKFNAITATDDAGDYLQTLAKGSRFETIANNADDILDVPGKIANTVTGNGWKEWNDPYKQPGNLAEVNKEEDGWLATQIAKYTEMTGQTANFANPYTAYVAMAGTVSQTGQENYDDLIAQGFSEQEAKLRATASGATQALIERWSSKFQAGVGAMFGKNAAKQVVTKTLPKKALGLLLMTQKEGGTEAAEEVLQTITNNVATNKPWNQGVVNAAVEGYKGGVVLGGVFAGGAAIESRTTNPDQAQQQNTAIQEQVGMLKQQKATNPQAAMQIDQQIGQLNQTRAQNNLAIATSLVPEGTALQKITQGIKKATTLNESGAIAGVGAYGYTDASKAGRVFEGVDGKPRFEVDDSGAKIKNLNGSTLGEVLDHPELYKNYPELKDVPVKYDSSPTFKGSFDGRTVRLNPLFDENSTKGTLLHELQHAIQEKEKFATGGDVPDISSPFTKASAQFREYQSTPAGKAAFRKNVLEALSKEPELTDTQAMNIAGHKLRDDWKNQQYRNLAGEAEARAVQARMNMPMSERYVKGKQYYHGSPDADKIRKEGFKIGERTADKRAPVFGDGVYMTTIKDAAEPYAKRGAFKSATGEVLEVNIPENLKLADVSVDDAFKPKVIERLKKQGYDGVRNDDIVNIFDPKKVNLGKATPRSTFYDSLDVSKDDLIVRNNNDTANSIFDSPAVRELKSTRKRLQTQYDNATSKTTKNQIAKAIKNIELEIRKEQSTSMSITGDADADAAIERDSVRNYLRSKPAVKGDATTGEGAQLPGKGMTQEQKQALIDKARAKVDPLESLKQEARPATGARSDYSPENLQANRQIRAKNASSITYADKKAIKPDELVTVYRAVPGKAKGGLTEGDWVTPNKEQARLLMKQSWVQDDTGAKIVTKKVKASELRYHADDAKGYVDDELLYVPKSDPLEALKQEARKYKSAEEFVKTYSNKNATDFKPGEPIGDVTRVRLDDLRPTETGNKEAIKNFDQKKAPPLKVDVFGGIRDGHNRYYAALESFEKDRANLDKNWNQQNLNRFVEKWGDENFPTIKVQTVNIPWLDQTKQLTDLYNQATSLKDNQSGSVQIPSFVTNLADRIKNSKLTQDDGGSINNKKTAQERIDAKTPRVADDQTIPTVDQLNAKLAKEGKKEFKAKGKIVSVKDSGKDGIDVTFENGETIKNASIPADLAPGRKIAGTETTVKQYQDAQDKLSAAMFRLLDSKDGSRKYNNNTGSSLMWSTGFTSNLVAPEAIAYSKQNNVPLEEGILESIKKAGHLKKDGYGTDPYIDLKNELTKTKPNEEEYTPEYYSDEQMQQMAKDNQEWIKTQDILQKNSKKSNTELSKLTGMTKQEVADYKSEVADATKASAEMNAMFEKNDREADAVAKKKIPGIVKRIKELKETDTSKLSKRALGKLSNDASSLTTELMQTMDDLYGTDKQVKFDGETYYVKGEVKIGKDTYAYLDGEGDADREFVNISALSDVKPTQETPAAKSEVKTPDLLTDQSGTIEAPSESPIIKKLTGKQEVKTPSIKSIQKEIDSLKLAQQNSDTVAGAKSYQKDIDELEASLTTKKQIPTTKKVATPKVRGKTDLKFIETVKESKNTSPDIKTELTSIKAATKSNVSTIRAAARRINKRGLNKSVEQSHDPNVHTLEQQSERLVLIEELQKQNRNGDAVTVVEEFARSARKLGQATQIAAAYNKLTPAGILKLAQREIDKAKKVNPRKYKDLKLDPAKAKELTDKVTKVQRMKEGPEKVKATRDMLDDVDAIVPTPTARKITTLWKAGLLTGVKGGIAGNTVGNTSYQIMRKIADVPSAGLDVALGAFTGTRSRTFTLRGLVPGFGEGLKIGAERMKTGTGADDLSSKYDYKKTQYGKGMLGRAAQAYTDTVFNFYSAADKPFFNAALQNSLQDLVRTEATNRKLTGEAKKNFIKRNMLEPSDDINTQAVAEAEKAVFQNKNALGAALSGFKQNLARKGGAPGEIASEIIAPFTGVPSAIATAAYDFSLINTAVETVKAIKESNKGTFDQKSQRALTESFGKGLTGTALLGLGYQLVGSGLMTLGYPDDPDERALWDLEKKTPYSIKVGGKWRSLNYTGPVMAIMAIGGETQKIQEAEGGNKLQSLKGGVFGSGKAILSSSPLQGAQGALNAITDPQRYGDSYVNNLAGSVIPTIVKDVSRTTDTKDGKVVEREVNNPWQSIQNRTPWRDKLDPKRDKFGQDITSTSPIGAVIDPFKSSDAQTSPMQRELRRLFEAKEGTSPPKVDAKVSIGGTENRSEITLTDKQLNAYKKQVGDATMTAWDAMMKTDKYKALSDSDKRKALENVAEDINAVEMRKFQADNQIGEYAPGFTGEQKDLEKRQKQMLKDGFNADKYTKASRTGGGTVDIPDGLSKDYTSILEKHADMTDEERDKVAYSQNDYDYNYKVARYESDKLAGKLSKAEDINRKQELVKEQVGKDFTKETREVYNSLSKEEIDGLDDETYRKAVDYGDALVDAGIIKKNKLRTYARGSGRSGSSKKAKKISIDMLKKASVVPNVNINTKSRKMRVAIPKAPSFKYRTPRVATTKLSKAQLPTSRRVNIS